ncbi:MAG: DUF1499 domain-containing protein [Gemmatimonadales bacterium]|nr:DUF1499 domain-containing protein [Gemmatimonadales bacterium]
MSPIFVTLVVAAVVAAVGCLVLALQVEDWRRDLTTNVAETDPRDPDPLLRPLEVSLSVGETVVRIESAVNELPRWQLVDTRADSGTSELRFVRTSRFFRFHDDVTVWVEQRGDGSVIRARSASRIGTGDLGQNPRNLRELMAAILDRVDAVPHTGAG